MPKENAPELFGLFHYIHQLSDETKRGMKTSLEECPRCHFVMLEGVLANIEQHGNGWETSMFPTWPLPSGSRCPPFRGGCASWSRMD